MLHAHSALDHPARRPGTILIEALPAALDRAAELTTLGPRPLAVVTAAAGTQRNWAARQGDLARTVPGSTHASLVEDEGDAAESGRAIRDIVQAVRTR